MLSDRWIVFQQSVIVRRSAARLVVTVGVMLLAALPGAYAEQPRHVYQIGVLLSGDQQASRYPVLLREQLRALGYREGENIVLLYRFDEGRRERLPGLATDLVRHGVDVIVAGYDEEILAARRLTTSIPIVMLAGVDPIGHGLVATLARPGGNVTGLTYETGPEVAGKRIEILKEALPGLKELGFFFNPRYPGMAGYVDVWKATTQALRLRFQAFEARDPRDFPRVFPIIKQAGPGALFVGDGWNATTADRQRVVDFTIQARLPAMFVITGYVELGGLIAYVPADDGRAERGAVFIDKILKGAKPADLPVEQPTRFELIINLRTARALGVTIPRSLLLRADRVIE